MNRKIRFWASAFLIFLSMFILLPVVGVLADDGTIRNIWLDMLEVFPFGGALGELTVNIVSKVLGEYIDINEYLAGSTQPEGPAVWMQEVAKLCMTGIFYGALTAAVDNWIEVKKTSKGWAGVQRILWHMFCALLASILCGLVFQFFLSQLVQLTPQAGRIIADVVMFGVAAGGIWVYILILGALGNALVYVVIKLIVVNTLNVVASYMLMLAVLLCLSEKAYLMLAGSIGTWGVIIVMLIGLDIILSSVLEK